MFSEGVTFAILQRHVFAAGHNLAPEGALRPPRGHNAMPTPDRSASALTPKAPPNAHTPPGAGALGGECASASEFKSEPNTPPSRSVRERSQQFRHAGSHGLPDEFQHDPVILVGRNVLHAGDSLPRYLRESRTGLGADALRRLAKHHQVVQHRADRALVRAERFDVHARKEARDALARVAHVLQAL